MIVSALHFLVNLFLGTVGVVFAAIAMFAGIGYSATGLYIFLAAGRRSWAALYKAAACFAIGLLTILIVIKAY